MLIGQFEGRVGEKSQVSFPKKFREVIGDTLIITKGFEACLIIVAEVNWKTLLEGTEGKPFTNRSSRELQRFLLGNATLVELDAKGRFVVPEYLRKFANISDNIVYAGIDRFVEMWDKKRWEDQQEKLSENISFIAEKLTNSEND